MREYSDRASATRPRSDARDPEHDPPSVTVVIPAHDRPSLLARTLASIVSQARVDLDVVVVDDGSARELAPSVHRFADERIRVLRNETAQGVSRARNRGIDSARGDWVAFCDDDDLWAPDKLAAQVAAAREVGAPWAYAGHVNITIEDEVIGGAPPAPPTIVRRDLPRTNLIPGGGSNVLVRTDVVRGIGKFDVGLGILEDWDLWIRLAREAAPGWVPRPLIGYRIHATNSSRNIDRMESELAIIDDRYQGPVDRVRFDRHLARVSLRGGDRRRAAWFTGRAALRAAAARDVDYFRNDLTLDARTMIVVFAPQLVARSVTGSRRRESRSDPWLVAGAAWIDALRAGAEAT
jgi:glycosyltransferase involved in cell wall biosynthesis